VTAANKGLTTSIARETSLIEISMTAEDDDGGCYLLKSYIFVKIQDFRSLGDDFRKTMTHCASYPTISWTLISVNFVRSSSSLSFLETYPHRSVNQMGDDAVKSPIMSHII
jgi:hypothetical protein